jgi:hypothetical protein
VESTRNSVGLILVALLGGCSLALSGPASPRSRGEVPSCDTGKGPVVLDGLGAAAFGIGGLAALGSDGKEAGAVLLGAGALLAISAVRGQSTVSDCREAFSAYAQEKWSVQRRTQNLATMPVAAPAVAPPVISAKTVPAGQPAPAEPATKQLDVTPPPTAASKPAAVEQRTPKQPPNRQPGAPDWSQFWQEQP